MSHGEQGFTDSSSTELDTSDLTSMLKRRPGRPSQDRDQVGRGFLLLKMQQFMLERSPLDFQRKDFAEFAHISPALVTYYFPQREDIVYEAAEPAISAHRDQVRRIISSEDDTLVRTKRLILEIVKFYFHRGYMQDYFDLTVKKKNILDDMKKSDEYRSSIIEFLSIVASMGPIRRSDAALLHSTIVAQCIFLAEQTRSRLKQSVGDMELSFQEMTDEVFAFLTSGIGLEN